MSKNDRHFYINPNISATDKQPSSASDAEEPSSTDTDPPEKGLMPFFVKYAERGSMTGVPYIHQSKNPSVKLIWSCLLLAACGLMTFHLYTLATTYFEYKKQTQIQLSFSSLQFPAVTICNVNPVRMSQRDLASEALNNYMDSVAPSVVVGYLDEWEPDLYTEGEDTFDEEEDGFYTDEDEDFEVEYQTFASFDRRKRETIAPKKNNNKTNADAPKSGNRNNTGVSRSSSSNRKRQGESVRRNNFFDEMKLTIEDDSTFYEAVDDIFEENDRGSWEAEASLSGFYEIEQTFRQMLAMEARSVRAQLGHQIHDMLLQCSFAGRKCKARNFTRLLTSRHGNCYTLEYPKFISRKSGPSDGLQLKLFLETDEYVPAITSSKGVQVVIHDQGTLPFPDDEGISVKAGTETSISLRRVEVSRLDEPYDKCTPVQKFKEKYGVKYTRNACQKLCQQVRTRKECGCYDIMQQEANKILKTPRSLRSCQSLKELKCSLNISLRFEKDSTTCGCYRPCTETTFEKTASSKAWPNPSLANLLATAACKQDSQICDDLKHKEGIYLREEFVKLSIFYEDLNYEELTEQANYEFDQFLSDIGGTIGLWIGLSILSVFELLHLFADICGYLCFKPDKN